MSDQEIDFDLFLQNQGYNHPQAVPVFFDAYYAQVYRLMASLLPLQEEVEIACQSAIESIALSLANYQPGTDFKLWLYSQVVQIAKTYRSKSNKSLQALPEIENSLKYLIFRLPQEYHFPLVLRYVHQLSLPEIARILGMSIDAARDRLQQGRLEIQALQQAGFSASWELYHQEYRNLFSLRLDGEISREQAAYLEHHLFACSRCADFLAAIDKMHASLTEKMPALWPLPDIDESQLEQIARKITLGIQRRRVLLRSVRYVKESGYYLFPVVLLILLAWIINDFRTPDSLPATSISAGGISTPWPLPARPPIEPEPEVIRVLARQSPAGFYPGNVSEEPAISADGKWVAFSSKYGFLVEDDPNLTTSDVFLLNTDTGSLERIELEQSEGWEEAPSYSPDISNDGSKIIFLAQGERWENCAHEEELFLCAGLFLYDRQENKTRLITILRGMANSDAPIPAPVISGNGSRIAYWYLSSPQQASDSVGCGYPLGCMDIYILDLEMDTADHIPVGRPASFDQEALYSLDISDDGQRLVFPVFTQDLLYSELAANFVQDDLINMFVYYSPERRIQPINVSAEGIPGNGQSTSARISGNGRFVLFASSAGNLTGDNPKTGANLYVRDLQNGQIELIGDTRQGTETQTYVTNPGLANYLEGNFAISLDGRWLVFLSADDRSSDAQNRMCSSAWVSPYVCYQLVLYDRWSKTSQEVQTGDQGKFQFGHEQMTSIKPGISEDGSRLVFVGNPVDCMSDQCPQVFAHDIRLSKTLSVSDIAYSEQSPGSQWELFEYLEGHDGWVNSVAFSPNGRYLASGGVDGVARVWRTEDWSEVTRLSGHSRPVTQVAFSPNGAYLVTGGLDSSVRIWWLPGDLVQELDCVSGEVLSLAYSPDGGTLAVGTSNGLHIFRVSGRRFNPCGRARFLQGSANTLAFSPDGKWLAFSSRVRGKVWLYNLPSGYTMFELDTSQGRILALAFSPDGKFLAAASEKKDVNLWALQLESGQLAVTYLDTFWHRDWVKSLAFSADSKLLATGSFDNAIRLWDVQRREIVQTLWRTRQDQVLSLAFSPDGKTLASGSIQGLVRLWGVSVQQERQPAKADFFSFNDSDMIGYLSYNETPIMPIIEAGLRGYPSISQAIEDLPFHVIVPGIELPRFTPSGVYTLQGQPESSPSLILNNIYATNYQPAYLVIRQGLEGSFLHDQTIGASAVVEKLQVGSQTAEYVHGDWSVEDNSIPFVSHLETPRLRWDAENGSHWLRWKAGDLYISLEFHTRFSDRMIEEDERITKEFLLAIAESFVPLGAAP